MNWEEPPRAQRGDGSGFWHGIVEELKEHPGRWAKHPKRMSRGHGTHLKRDFPGLEVTTRNHHTDEDGKDRCDLYYRWMGVKND